MPVTTQRRTRATQGHAVSRSTAVWLFTGALLGAVLSVASPAVRAGAASESGLRFVGSMPWDTGSTVKQGFPFLVIDEALQRGFFPDGNGLKVYVYDLRSMKKTATVAVPGWKLGVDQIGGWAFDPDGHRIFAGSNSFVCGVSSPNTNSVNILRTDTLEVSSVKLPCNAGPEGQSPVGEGLKMQGMWYDREVDRLYVVAVPSILSQFGTGAVLTQALIYRIDPETGLADPGWPVNVGPPCFQFQNFLPSPQGLVRRVGDSVVALCTSNGKSQNYAVRIALDPSGAPKSQTDFESKPLIGGYVGAFFDNPTGLMLLTTNSSGNGIGTYVVDQSLRFTGNVAMGSIERSAYLTSVGVDQGRGRLYQRNQHGLVIADIRQTPVPAGILYPELRDAYDGKGPGGYYNPSPIAVDASTHRIFIPDPSNTAFLVYEDTMPASVPPPRDDPDKGTSDMAEVPGQTAVNYSGSANAYGAAWLSRGGPGRVVTNKDSACFSTTGDAPSPEAQVFGGSCAIDAFVNQGDRAWYFGHVSKLAFSNSGASTFAAPAHLTDAPTHNDFRCTAGASLDRSGQIAGQAQSNCPMERVVEGGGGTVAVPAGKVECTDFHSGVQEPTPVATPFGQAAAKCDSEGGSVSAAARFKGGDIPTPAPLDISIGEAWSDVSSVKDPAKGVGSKAVAVSRGVRIGPDISIGEVLITATSSAQGRSGTARAEFDRRIRDFKSPSYSCAAACDPQQVLNAVNNVLTRVGGEALLPEPDTTYFPKGSPRGYQALVTKNEADQISDKTINGDFNDTVVGLRLVFYSDGAVGPSRQIVDLTGIHVESHYGVFPLEAASGFPNLPSPVPGEDNSFLDDPAVVTGVVEGGPPALPVVLKKKSLPRRVAEAVGGAIADVAKTAWRLVVSEPGTGARLMLALLILAAPLYLALRRRDFVRFALRSGDTG